jgi:hypothetical protein
VAGWRVKCIVRTVLKLAEAQGILVAPLDPQRSSHLDHPRFRPLTIPHNLVLEPLALQSQHAVFAGTPFVIPGLLNPASNPSDTSLSCRVIRLFSPSLSMLAVLLTPVAVLAGALGVWRLGADPGWTNPFFIANGLLSHWQAWFAVAIGVYGSGHSLHRWLANQVQVASNNNGRLFSN